MGNSDGTAGGSGLSGVNYDPPPPPGGKTSGSVDSIFLESTFQFTGVLSDFTTSRLNVIKEKYCQAVLFTLCRPGTEITVSAGSVIVVILLPVDSKGEFEALQSTIATTFPTLASINSILSPSDLTLSALDIPVVVAVIEYGDDDDDIPLIVGSVVGGLCGLLLVGL